MNEIAPKNLGEIIRKMHKKLKVVWLSANWFGYELLDESMKLKTIAVTAIITLSDKATTKMYDGVDNWSKFNVPIYEIENINECEVLLQAFNPDIVMMCGWRQIINKKILDIPRLGFIGFHPTLLPKGRGSAPIINTILEGVKESGVTMFYADEGVDSGDIIGIEHFNVDDDDHASDVYDNVIEAGKGLVKTYLPLIAEGKAPRTPQPEEEATYLPKRTLKDNEIHLETETPEEIYRKIRAFSHPYNGAFVRLGDKKLIIRNAELEDTIKEEGEEKEKTNLAVLISGRGSNLKAIIDAIKSGYLDKVDLKVVVANKHAEGLKYASEAGIPGHIVSRKYHPGSEEMDLNKHDKLVLGILEEYDIDLIALAGYDQILQKEFVNKYRGRIMNIHPSLLPSFKNTLHAQKEALDSGVKISGCTVHFVEESVDTGPIIIQRAVPVRDDDTPETLADRILKHEHVIYPEAIKLFSEGRLKIVGRKVVVKRRNKKLEVELKNEN